LAKLYTARNTLGEGSYGMWQWKASGNPFGPPFSAVKTFYRRGKSV